MPTRRKPTAKKATAAKVAHVEEQIEDKVLENLDARRYTRTHMLVVVLLALLLPNVAWMYLGDLTGGKITKPKTETDVQLECVQRILDDDTMDDVAFRTAVKVCVPEDGD